MNPIMMFKKVAASAVLVAVIGATAGGCAYSGVATTPDGTVILTRNGLLGSLRKVFICKVAGTALTCVESPSPP
jgi:hypothetical protein